MHGRKKPEYNIESNIANLTKLHYKTSIKVHIQNIYSTNRFVKSYKQTLT